MCLWVSVCEYVSCLAPHSHHFISSHSLFRILSFIYLHVAIDLVKGLKIIHLNIRSIVSKIDLLRAWVTLYKPNIITVSETWLHESITDDEIEIDNFVLYRADRSSRGGGVATSVAANLASNHICPSVEPVNFECLFVSIIFNENKHLTIGNIYRPPSAPVDSTLSFLSTINSLERHNELIILGD